MNHIMDDPEVQRKIKKIKAILKPDEVICCVCEEPNGFYRYSEKKAFCDYCYRLHIEEYWLKVKKQYPERFLPFCNVGGVFTKYSFDFYKKDFPHLKTLKEYPNESNLYDIFMHGEPGHGKTGLAISIIRALIRRGCDTSKIHYTTENDLKKELIFHQDNKFDKEKAWNKVTVDSNFLVFDEVGNYKTSDFVATTTKELIDERIKLGFTTILITNLAMPKLMEFYGKPFISRLQTFKQIIIKSEDYRSKLK